MKNRIPTAAIACGLLLACLVPAGCGNGGAADSAGSGTGDYTFVNPLLDGEVGEWALYTTEEGRKTFRLELLELNPLSRRVTFLQEWRLPATNELVHRESTKVGPNHFLWGKESAGFVIRKIYTGRVAVAGRTWDALCIETLSRGQGEVREWYSSDVPVIGLLKSERLEKEEVKPISELIEWSGKNR